MAVCLNTKSAYKDFNMLVNDYYFVDKSVIIEKISARINTKNRYVCITKPCRFGKTSVLNMLSAYYCRAMVNDTSVIIDIKQEYSSGQEHPANRKDIYSAMIIYGLLSYCEGELRIPNKGLMIEFENALEDDDFGYVAEKGTPMYY